MSRSPGIELHGVHVSLGGREVLTDVSLAFRTGVVTGIMGPNGSGKSTLLRCLFGSVRPQGGHIDIDGDDVGSLSPTEVARRVAVVTQDQPATFDFTVHDVVALGRVPHRTAWGGLSRRDQELIQSSLERTGTAHLQYRQVGTLSGGERQRVMVARALVQQTRYLLLDEPTNHLDIRYRLEVLHLIRSLDITTIVALHDLDMVGRWCDQAVLMANGRVLAVGQPDEVLTPDRCGEAFDVAARAFTDTFDGTRVLRFDLPHR